MAGNNKLTRELRVEVVARLAAFEGPTEIARRIEREHGIKIMKHSIARYGRALERAGVATDTWWERQLDLCLLAMTATMGWEKAVGDAAELAWWSEHAQAAATRWL